MGDGSHRRGLMGAAVGAITAASLPTFGLEPSLRSPRVALTGCASQ